MNLISSKMILFLSLFTSRTIFAQDSWMNFDTKNHGPVVKDFFETLKRIDESAESQTYRQYVDFKPSKKEDFVQLFDGKRGSWMICSYYKDLENYRCGVQKTQLTGDRSSPAYALYLGMRSIFTSNDQSNPLVDIKESEYSYIFSHKNVPFQLKCARDSIKNKTTIDSLTYTCSVGPRFF